MDGIHNELDDSVITKALGEEIRRVRDGIGWSRARLVAEMRADIHVQTLATYEQGVRQCTVVRLVEICRALGVSPPVVLNLALQRAQIDLRMIGLHVDIHAIARDERAEHDPIRQWADRRLAAEHDGTGVVYLDRAVIQELAVLFGYTEDELEGYLMDFIPERAPRQKPRGRRQS